MASAGARAYNGGLGAEPPAGVQGQSPQWGDGANPPEADRFSCLNSNFNGSDAVLHEMIYCLYF